MNEYMNGIRNERISELKEKQKRHVVPYTHSRAFVKCISILKKGEQKHYIPYNDDDGEKD